MNKMQNIPRYPADLVAIRGATSVDQDDITHVTERVLELYHHILIANVIDKIITIFFSVTPDIRAINPATIIRTNCQLDEVAFFCCQEAMFANSRPRIIRILILAKGTNPAHFVYLHSAKNLRDTPSI